MITCYIPNIIFCGLNYVFMWNFSVHDQFSIEDTVLDNRTSQGKTTVLQALCEDSDFKAKENTTVLAPRPVWIEAEGKVVMFGRFACCPFPGSGQTDQAGNL
jgi:hypothetical protein